MDWTAHTRESLEETLETGPQGLTPEQVDLRRQTHGANVLDPAKAPGVLAILVHQFRSPLVYILLIATAVTLAIEEYVDAAVIFAVLALNAAIGFFQERKADRAVRALMGLVTPQAHVIRSGRHQEVASADLVPGDLVVLESGQRVPADLRLAAVTALTVDESLLTGESLPVRKRAEQLEGDLALGDRVNLAFTGTVVTSGRGRGYVVSIGRDTELGKIATQIREETEPLTPLQERMNKFAKVIGAVVAIAALASVGVGMLRGESAADMFLVGVALAVSAIPEGLPVVFTITLAVGVRRMAQRNAVIRRLPAVETLGSITTIGSDKTGTLTMNRMTVAEVWSGRRSFEIEAGTLSEPLRLTLLAGILSNEATAHMLEGESVTTGDPTEAALLVAGHRMGVDADMERTRWSSLDEVPFEAERRFSASLQRSGDETTLFVKGAPERVLAMCTSLATEAGPVPLDIEEVNEILRQMASRGFRVLAMAYQPNTDDAPAPLEPSGLTFLGLQGMLDPPREGVREAIAACQASGIRVLMITGDHADTALAIAADLAIASNGRVVSGQEMETMDVETLRDLVLEVSVFARVAPEHKLQVVQALQHHSEVVAVTGDGVNDAPALKVADVGVAMGRSGTDVAREAADMVLADDNFVSIFEAVREGRVTFDNLRKVTFFLISSGAAEILVIIAAVAAGWPLPMIPAQILWLNLVTNGVQDVALAFEPEEPGVVTRPPRPRGESIVSRLLWQRTVLSGIVMAIGTLVLFRWTLNDTGSLVQAQTVALTTMVIFQAVHAGNARSEHLSAFRLSLFSNPMLLIAVLGAVSLHVAALYLPFTQFVLRVEPLPVGIWPVILAVSVSVLAAVELDKWLRRRARRGVVSYL